MLSYSFVRYSFKYIQSLSSRSLPGEFFGPPQSAFSKVFSKLRISQHLIQLAGNIFNAVRINQKSCIPYYFRQARQIPCDNGSSAPHCLERGQAEPFKERRINETCRG